MKHIIEWYGLGRPLFINRRKASVRSLRANADGSVDVEVYHQPYWVCGDDVKVYRWHLYPCEVHMSATPSQRMS